MIPEPLQQLLRAGESLDVEFKGEGRGPLSDAELVEAAVCLANRSSDRTGWLLVGVEDDGRITGARHRHHDRTDPLRVQALIAHRTRPTLSVRVEVIPIQGKDVIAIEIPTSRLIQKPEAEARGRLQRLVEAGLVEPRGERKGRLWHLSANAYRRLGQKAAYVRQRGFEPLQQEQMVLQYVEKHGRITRSAAAELCRLGPHQATRLLGRLVQDGRLVRRGTRKGTHYVTSGGNKI